MAEIIDHSRIDIKRLESSNISFDQGISRHPIYHYTSIGGLEGVLRKKALWFTNIKYMNDKDETIAGYESLVKILGISEDKRESLLPELKKSNSQAFVCCFSLEEDSLPMWNYYTKEVNNQGYNIEFDDLKLVENILRNNPCLDGCKFAFGEVDYSKDNDSEYSKMVKTGAEAQMELLVTRILLAVAQGAFGKTNIDEKAVDALEKKVQAIEETLKKSNLPVLFFDGEKCSFEKGSTGNYLHFIKRDCFRQEREFRMVVTVPNELLPELKKQEVYEFRVSNGVLIPYIELKFTEEVVKSITISPTVQSDLVEESIKDFMQYCGYRIPDFSTFIKHSKVPVRF